MEKTLFTIQAPNSKKKARQMLIAYPLMLVLGIYFYFNPVDLGNSYGRFNLSWIVYGLPYAGGLGIIYSILLLRKPQAGFNFLIKDNELIVSKAPSKSPIRIIQLEIVQSIQKHTVQEGNLIPRVEITYTTRKDKAVLFQDERMEIPNITLQTEGLVHFILDNVQHIIKEEDRFIKV